MFLSIFLSIAFTSTPHIILPGFRHLLSTHKVVFSSTSPLPSLIFYSIFLNMVFTSFDSMIVYILFISTSLIFLPRSHHSSSILFSSQTLTFYKVFTSTSRIFLPHSILLLTIVFISISHLLTSFYSIFLIIVFPSTSRIF